MHGKLVRKYRKIKKLSVDFVAEEMGITPQEYEGIENNITPLTVEQLKKISKIMKVSFGDLMKDGFEIHRPVTMRTNSITKENLLDTIDEIIEKLEEKKSRKHEYYPVLMLLVQNMDHIVSGVH
jgi:transcriptional regulator with XRE-family HTH domain